MVTPAMLSFFMPRPAELGRISVYAESEAVTPSKIAAAMGMAGGNITAALFAVVRIDDVEKLGGVVHMTPGETKVAEVDALHRDIELPTIDIAIAVCAAFLAQEEIEVSVNSVRAALVGDVAKDRLKLKPKSHGSKAWSAVQALITDDHLRVSAPVTI